jgi:hypothetical protein
MSYLMETDAWDFDNGYLDNFDNNFLNKYENNFVNKKAYRYIFYLYIDINSNFMSIIFTA